MLADADLLIKALALAFEMVLLGFLYLISRFYEAKFGKRTYYNAYIVPIAAFVIMVPPAIFMPDLFPAALVTLNLLALLVLAVFGLRLHRMMMGVTK